MIFSACTSAGPVSGYLAALGAARGGAAA
jgi:hypothetical protein